MAELNQQEWYQHCAVMGQYLPNEEAEGQNWEALSCSSSLMASTNEGLKGGEWKLSMGHNLEAETAVEQILEHHEPKNASELAHGSKADWLAGAVQE